MGNCLNKNFSLRGPQGIQGPTGPQGPPGLPSENCEETYLPNAPSYPFPECGTCERVNGELLCSEIENEDKFYILGVRNDNSTYWKIVSDLNKL